MQAREGRFEGRVAVVTGSSGIGLGTARRLAREGARVALWGNDPARNAVAEAACDGLAVSVSTVDVTDAAAVGAAVAALDAGAGRIDALVNAAGLQTYGDLEATDGALWDRTLDVNLRALFLTSRAIFPVMKRGGGGSIVQVSSVQGHVNQRGVLAYATAKGAVHAMTRAMAVDCAAAGVRVNSVSPGSIRTPLLEFAAQEAAREGQSIDEVIAGFGAAHPLGRVGTVEEVAALIAFLASDEAGFCTGGDYLIDGGLSAALGV
jgi:NAD(P)-dependent dehydrogenase (short-subunit alcohol dehydrogenase family)